MLKRTTVARSGGGAEGSAAEGGTVAAAVCVHCVSFCEAAVENYATIVQLQMQNNQIKRAGQGS